MMTPIFKFEIKYWISNPTVWIYGGMAFLFGLISMAGNAGLWDTSDGEVLRLANSPYALFQSTAVFTKLILFIVPAILGHALCRDFESRTHHILFSYPINKMEYLAGKFLSAFSVVAGISLLFLIGCYGGICLPGVDENRLADFHGQLYADAWLIWLLPNVFFIAVFSFATALFSRSVSTAFIAVVVLLILRELLIRLTTSAEPAAFSFLLDPLGETATRWYTRSWTIAEQNASDISFTGYLAWNRAFWLLFSGLMLLITFRRFQFSDGLTVSKRSRQQKTNKRPSRTVGWNWPEIKYAHSFFSSLKKSWLISLIEFWAIVKSGAFISILLAGSVLVYVLLSQMNAPYGVRLLPATWVMLAFPVLFFTLLIHFVTFLYAGVLINRYRMYGMMPVVDSTAIPNWSLALSKLLALMMIQATLLLVVMLVGILVQFTQGFYRIELAHYLFDLLFIHGIGFLIWALASLLVHSVISNSWVGLLLLILMYFGVSELPQLGIEAFIFRFNQTPHDNFFLYYSDFSGHGRYLLPFFIYKTYWLAAGLLAFVLGLGFWRRGVPLPLAERLKLLWGRLLGPLFLPALGLLISVLLFGFWIQNEEKEAGIEPVGDKNGHLPSSADDLYKQYSLATQPRVVAVKMEMHLYPQALAFQAAGTYQLVNRSGRAIDSIFISTSPEVLTEFSIHRPSSPAWRDTLFGFYILRLHTSLMPGDTVQFDFQLNSKPNHIFRPNTLMERNGAYITSLICPAIGFRPEWYTASPADTAALTNHYRSFDSDFISFETLLSTSDDQIAIAPGDLVGQWSKNGRRFFRYRSAYPSTNDYAFLSGQYAVTQSQWNQVGIEIYHHPDHGANVQHLIAGLKATLDYCEEHFSPYPHRQIRIVEYSRRVGDFAQSFTTTIPCSEIGFMTDIDEEAEEGINLPFLGAAHELAHQWWGMQAIPADVSGAKMITESMAEYVSLKVLEKAYGKSKAMEYLEKSHNIYWRKSREQTRPEPPLILNTGNDLAHIPYQKGMLALHAMSHYLGETVLNQAMKGYLDAVRFRGAPYTTSLEMVEHIRRATPDSLQYRIADLFETHTFYDNQLANAKVIRRGEGDYEVELEVLCEKYRLAGATPSSQLMNEVLEIGFYSNSAHRMPEELRQIRAKSGNNRLRFRLPFPPDKIAIDPNLLLLDKNRSNNSIRL